MHFSIQDQQNIAVSDLKTNYFRSMHKITVGITHVVTPCVCYSTNNI